MFGSEDHNKVIVKGDGESLVFRKLIYILPGFGDSLNFHWSHDGDERVSTLQPNAHPSIDNGGYVEINRMIESGDYDVFFHIGHHFTVSIMIIRIIHDFEPQDPPPAPEPVIEAHPQWEEDDDQPPQGSEEIKNFVKVLNDEILARKRRRTDDN